MTCFVCPVPDPPLAGRIYARGVFLPVEEMPHGFLRYDTLNWRLGNSKGCLKYYGQESLPSDSSAGSHQVPKFVAASSSQTLGGSKGNRRDDNQYFKGGILRDVDPKKGEPDSVTLKCKSCGRTRLDQVPAFLSYTGEYVWTSPYCFEPGCQKKSWIPVRVKDSVVMATIKNRMKDPVNRWEHTPPHLRGPEPVPGEEKAKKPANKPAAKKRLLSSRDDDDDDDEDDEDEVPRKKARS